MILNLLFAACMHANPWWCSRYLPPVCDVNGVCWIDPGAIDKPGKGPKP